MVQQSKKKIKTEFEFYHDMAKMLKKNILESITAAITVKCAGKGKNTGKAVQPYCIYVDDDSFCITPNDKYKRKVESILLHGLRVELTKGIVTDYETISWGDVKLEDMVKATKYL